MKATILAMLAAAITMPAAAAEQPTGGTPPKQAQSGPHTVKGELTLFQFTDYNGDNFVVDGTSRVVKTDWPIRACRSIRATSGKSARAATSASAS